MNSVEHSKCLVHFLSPAEIRIGCGFVCGTRHVFTCTHVIEDALGGRSPRKGDRVRAVMPEFTTPDGGGEISLQVELAYPVSAGENAAATDAGKFEDICLLTLAEDLSLPLGAVIARSDIERLTDGLSYRGWGLRAYDPKMESVADVEIRGTTRGRLRNRQWILAEHNDEASRPGSSGAAVFNELHGVLGMVVIAQGYESGRIVPIDILNEIFQLERVSGQRSPVVDAKPDVAGTIGQRDWSRAFRKFDRILQASEFQGLLDDSIAMGRSGLICVVGGIPDDLVPHCRDRFRDELWQRHFDELCSKNRVPRLKIPVQTGIRQSRIARALRSMKYSLREAVKAGGIEAADIRAAIALGEKPVLIDSMVPHHRIGEHELALLREWSAFIDEISCEPMDNPLIHVLQVEFAGGDIGTGEDASVSDLEQLFDILFESLRGDDEADPETLGIVNYISLLHPVATDDLTSWLGSAAIELDLDDTELDALISNAKREFGTHGKMRLSAIDSWLQGQRSDSRATGWRQA